MTLKTITLALLFICLFSVKNFAQSIDDYVTLSVNVDDKPVKSDKVKIEVVVDQIKITPLVSDGGFSADQLQWIKDKEQKTDLKIFFKGYVLDVTDVSKGHFKGEWRIFINNPPFTVSEDIPNPEKVDYVYAIQFNSGNSMGTTRSNIKYKDANPEKKSLNSVNKINGISNSMAILGGETLCHWNFYKDL